MRQLHLSSFDELHRLVCNGCNVAGFCSHFTCKEMIRCLYDYEATHGVQIILAGSFMLVPRQGSATRPVDRIALPDERQEQQMSDRYEDSNEDNN